MHGGELYVDELRPVRFSEQEVRVIVSGNR